MLLVIARITVSCNSNSVCNSNYTVRLWAIESFSLEMAKYIFLFNKF